MPDPKPPKAQKASIASLSTSKTGKAAESITSLGTSKTGKAAEKESTPNKRARMASDGTSPQGIKTADVKLSETLDYILEEVRKHTIQMKSLITKGEMEAMVGEQTVTLSNRLETISEQMAEAIEKIESLEEDLAEASTEIANLKEENKILRKLTLDGLRWSNENAQYSRRENLIFNGVPSTSVNDKETICSYVKAQLNIDIQPQELAAAHRLPRKEKKAKEEDSMIVKFRNREQRDHIYQNRNKVTMQNSWIREDTTAANRGLINRVNNHEKFSFGFGAFGKMYAVSDDKYKISVRLFEDLNVLYDSRKAKGKKLKERKNDDGTPFVDTRRRHPTRTQTNTSEFTLFQIEL